LLPRQRDAMPLIPPLPLLLPFFIFSCRFADYFDAITLSCLMLALP
jgi:hypothetical protein